MGVSSFFRQSFFCVVSGLLVALSPIAEVNAQTYRYIGNMPAAKMTLDMMEVMGYIQRVPDSQYGGGIPSSSPMTSMMSPMSSLGGLPMSAGMMAIQNPWSGMSPWPGMAAGSMMPAPPQIAPGASATPSQPGNGSIQVSPNELAALLNAVKRPLESVAPINQAPISDQFNEGTQSSLPATSSHESLPSGSENSGVTEESLSGVWRGNRQDVLVVIGQRFIWTDKNAQSIEGVITVQGDKLLTKLSSNGSVMAYRFKLEGDKFVAVTEAGHQYVFQRSE